MAETHSAIFTFLNRLQLGKYADKFKERDITRVVTLRQLSPNEFKAIVPDDEDRSKIMASMTQRGQIRGRGNGGVQNHHQDVYRSNSPPQHGGYNYHEGGRGRGRGRGRGSNNYNNNGDRRYNNNNTNTNNNNAASGEGSSHSRPCRLFFSSSGCRYGENCRYSHEAVETASGCPPSCEPLLEHHLTLNDMPPFSEEITVPAERIKFLIGIHGRKMKEINEKHKVSNDLNTTGNGPLAEGFITFKIHGSSAESVGAAKTDILGAVGLLNEEKKKDRFLYAVNELEIYVNAARYLCASNTANKGTPHHLSDRILRNIISTFRLVPPPTVKHFYINTGMGDKDKLDSLSKFVAQMNGVQAIIFCEANRVTEMSKGAARISRSMNNVAPIFVYPSMAKEERMTALEAFKEGVPNSLGIRQRLLVTTADYAKLSQKCEIPYVNFVVHFSLPKNDEFYALQSNVVGRSGTVGASILCVCPTVTKSAEKFSGLQQNIAFTELDSEESFSSTAGQLSYETVDLPMSSTEAYPPTNWREMDNNREKKNHQ